MRLRKKWWARPEMETSSKVIIEPAQLKGKWKYEFKNNNPIYLELGCGRGSFIKSNAEAHADINYIGIDLKDEVLIYALRKIEELETDNVRLIPMNIDRISDIFDDSEISRIYINFCNPWPKERHKKRRLTHTRFLNKYKGFITPNTEIWFKTDDVGLFEESKLYFEESGFKINFLTYDLHNSGFENNVVTEYERKFTELGMKTMFIVAEFIRNDK